MNIHELAELTGETPRQIRFLIAEGFVPSPAGGRSNASYGDEHVTAIRTYKRMRAEGLKPAVIKLMREGTVPLDMAVAKGVTLRVDLAELPKDTDPRHVADLVAEILADFTQKEPRHADAGNRNED